MALNPQFIVEMLNVLSNPPLMCELAVGLFYPEMSRDFQKWSSLQIQPNYMDTYKWLHQRFQSAPELDETLRVDELYRELLKHIIAKAFNLEYKTQPKILIH